MHESNERCEFPRDSKNLSTIIFSISERESGTYYGSEREDLVRDLKCGEMLRGWLSLSSYGS